MNIEDIKIGETYNVRMNVDSISDGFVDCLFVDGESCSIMLEPERLHHPEPKYDPYRIFRVRDKVRLVTRFGRLPFCHRMKEWIVPSDTILTVICDEVSGHVKIQAEEGFVSPMIVSAHFLELVTPVEELEPYRVETGGYNRFRIKKGNLEYSYFPFGEHCVLSMDEAKAAAEAECARLNAAFRKERENG